MPRRTNSAWLRRRATSVRTAFSTRAAIDSPSSRDCSSSSRNLGSTRTGGMVVLFMGPVYRFCNTCWPGIFRLLSGVLYCASKDVKTAGLATVNPRLGALGPGLLPTQRSGGHRQRPPGRLWPARPRRPQAGLARRPDPRQGGGRPARGHRGLQAGTAGGLRHAGGVGPRRAQASTPVRISWACPTKALTSREACRLANQTRCAWVAICGSSKGRPTRPGPGTKPWVDTTPKPKR